FGPARVLSPAIKAFAPDVAVGPDGRFLVAWHEERVPFLYTVIGPLPLPGRPCPLRRGPSPCPYMMGRGSWSSLVEDRPCPIPRRVWERLSLPTRERPEGSIGSRPLEDRYKANRLFALQGL